MQEGAPSLFLRLLSSLGQMGQALLARSSEPCRVSTDARMRHCSSCLDILSAMEHSLMGQGAFFLEFYGHHFSLSWALVVPLPDLSAARGPVMAAYGGWHYYHYSRSSQRRHMHCLACLIVGLCRFGQSTEYEYILDEFRVLSVENNLQLLDFL